MAKKAKCKKIQKAILVTIPFATAPGVALEELNQHLANGWKVLDVMPFDNEADNGPLSALVIIEGCECKTPAPKSETDAEEKPEKKEKAKKVKKEKKAKK